MKYTENYGLNLPEGTDFVDVEHFNENAEKVDEVLKTLEEPEHDTATQSELEELTSGESLKIALRKLAKAVADYISHKADKVAHITSEERKKWNDANTKKHEHGNKSVLDAATASYTTEEKTKLNGIATGANKTTIAANLTTTATGYALDATMGKQLQDNKVNKVSGKGLSTNDYTTAEKTKLAGIATGANKTVVDSAMSNDSTNPLQNVIITKQIKHLYALIVTQVASSIKWKDASSCYMNSSELGIVYYICMDETDTANNVGKEVLVMYNNGAIAIGKIVKSGSYYGLENPVMFLTDTTLPLVNKTTIQNGTNTLPHSNNGTIGYCIATGYGYGAVLEISKTNTFATKYLILP